MEQLVRVHGPDDVRLDEVPLPVVGPNDALVRIAACGICGTDLTFIRSGGAGPRGAMPLPLGHEAAGEIIALGQDVLGFHLGDRVLVNPMTGSGVIGNGGPDGAFRRSLVIRDAIPGESLLPIADGVPYEIAALAEPLAVALHGVNRAAAQAGERIVVFGAGPIGLGAVFWLKQRGVTEIVAVDLHDDRLERARALGAAATINAGREDFVQRLREIHGTTEVFGREAVDTHAFIDAAGAPHLLPQVVSVARRHARYVVVASYRTKVELDLHEMLTSEMTITTSVGYPDELKEVIESIPRFTEALQPMISHRLKFEDVIAGFDLARSPAAAKVMIAMA